MATCVLPFEKPIMEMEKKLKELQTAKTTVDNQITKLKGEKDYTDAQEYGELILLRELESAYETLASVNAQRRRKENETKKD